jgi:O-antigen/teichoic acid export membrane protein
VEAFALLGVYATVTALLLVFDLGLSATLTRELARLDTDDATRNEARDVARTLEGIYWVVGSLTGLALVFAAPAVAENWLRPHELPVEALRLGIMAMGIAIGLQWPISLYTGGLLGLQHHLALNVLTAGLATVQSLGAVVTVAFVSPSIGAFFLWQVVATGIFVAAFRWTFWRRLDPDRSGAAFRPSLLGSRWRFAGGMVGISLTSTVLTQTDKVILSTQLPLAEFGYYTFAFTVAGTLGFIAVPVYMAVYPRLVQLVARSDREGVEALYHGATQLVSVLLIPLGTMLAFFPQEILAVYARDALLPERAALLLALLAVGIGLNGIMLLPLALQLAYGWTSLSLWKNIVGAVVYVPFLLAAIAEYGAAGAAAAFIGLNLGYMLLEVPIMHTRLLRGALFNWYWADVIRPLLATLLVAVAGRAALRLIGPAWMAPYLLMLGVSMCGGAVLAAPRPVRSALARLTEWR